MTTELKAAVERALDKSGKLANEGYMDHVEWCVVFLRALADEPEVVDYLFINTEIEHREDVRDILKTLAKIVR